MDPITQGLQEVFHNFVGATQEVDSSQWVKICREVHNMNTKAYVACPVTLADADVVFAKAKVRGTRRLDFHSFCYALELIAQKKGVPLEDIVTALKSSAVKTKQNVDKENSAVGPERFYYDTKTWTGTHMKGGPQVIDKSGSSRVLNLSEIVDRSKGERPASTPNSANRAARLSPELGYRPTVKDSAQKRRAGRMDDSVLNTSSSGIRGPERFYYDTNTYTGVHRHSPYKATAESNKIPEQTENATPVSTAAAVLAPKKLFTDDENNKAAANINEATKQQANGNSFIRSHPRVEETKQHPMGQQQQQYQHGHPQQVYMPHHGMAYQQFLHQQRHSLPQMMPNFVPQIPTQHAGQTAPIAPFQAGANNSTTPPFQPVYPQMRLPTGGYFQPFQPMYIQH